MTTANTKKIEALETAKIETIEIGRAMMLRIREKEERQERAKPGSREALILAHEIKVDYRCVAAILDAYTAADNELKTPDTIRHFEHKAEIRIAGAKGPEATIYEPIAQENYYKNFPGHGALDLAASAIFGGCCIDNSGQSFRAHWSATPVAIGEIVTVGPLKIAYMVEENRDRLGRIDRDRPFKLTAQQETRRHGCRTARPEVHTDFDAAMQASPEEWQ
jgi:hypothetical protein